MGNGNRYLRALLGIVIFVGIIWLVYVGILADHEMARMTRKVPPPSRKTEHLVLNGKLRHFHQDLKIHYVNRRRVPTGPDPIHNRRASKARQLPGRF